MNKQILLIYQDCPDCNERGEWFREQQELAEKNHLQILPMPYNQPGIKEIILKAQEEGLEKTLLFYTDGNKFGNDISEFVRKPKNDKDEVKPDEVNKQD